MLFATLLCNTRKTKDLLILTVCTDTTIQQQLDTHHIFYISFNFVLAIYQIRHQNMLNTFIYSTYFYLIYQLNILAFNAWYWGSTTVVTDHENSLRK